MMSLGGRQHKNVFKCFLKDCSVAAVTTCSGKEFQIRGAATGKAQVPTVDVYIWLQQDYYIWRNRIKGSKSNRKGMRKKKGQPQQKKGNQGQCGLENGWLEDMSSDIMISYWQELHKEDPRGYRNCLRITPDLFQEMVEKLTPHIKKETTFMQEPLAVGLKLAATLSFLVTRNSYPIIQYSFKDEATILPEVCKAIIQVYKDEVLSCPKTEEEWKEVAEKFSSRWNYHNCLGAVDGKHVAMKKPP